MNALGAGHFHRTFRIGVGLLLATACLVPGQLQAQKGEAEFIPGKLVSLEKDKGKNHLLKMTRSDNDEEMQFVVGPKVPYRIVFKGDSGYLQPKTIVSAHLVEKGGDYSTKEATVYLALAPQESHKDGPKEGENKTHEIVGKVVSSNADGFTVDVNGNKAKVSFDKGFTVWVTGTEPELAKAGSEVNAEGIKLRNDKFQASNIEIKVTDPISYEDYEKLMAEKKTAGKRSTKKPVKKDAADGDEESPKTKKKAVRKKPADEDASY